jgi:hypothetical protein
VERHFARASTVGDAEMKTVGRAGGGHCTAAKPAEPLDGKKSKFLVPRSKESACGEPARYGTLRIHFPSTLSSMHLYQLLLIE